MKTLKDIIRKNLNLISESEPTFFQKYFPYFGGVSIPFKNSTESQSDTNSKNNLKKTKLAVNTETIEIQKMISKTQYANVLPTKRSSTGIDGYWGKRTSQALLSLLNDYENRTKNNYNFSNLKKEF